MQALGGQNIESKSRKYIAVADVKSDFFAYMAAVSGGLAAFFHAVVDATCAVGTAHGKATYVISARNASFNKG